jgi:hypothetical protein
VTRAGVRGLALLEVLVALVILTLVVLGYLKLLQGSHRLLSGSREWGLAAAHAADGMERLKLGLPRMPERADERLPDGFLRRTTGTRWQGGLALVRITVSLPSGGQLDVYRLAMADDETPRAAP